MRAKLSNTLESLFSNSCLRSDNASRQTASAAWSWPASSCNSASRCRRSAASASSLPASRSSSTARLEGEDPFPEKSDAAVRPSEGAEQAGPQFRLVGKSLIDRFRRVVQELPRCNGLATGTRWIGCFEDFQQQIRGRLRQVALAQDLSPLKPKNHQETQEDGEE